MNKKKVFNRLKRARNFAQVNSDTDYLLVHKESSKPKIGSLNFPVTVQQEINKLLTDSVSDLIKAVSNGEKDLRRFHISNNNIDEPVIECEAVSNMPNSELFQTIISNKTFPNTKMDLDNKPDLQLIRATDGEKVLVGIQNSRKIKSYTKSSGLSLMYDNEMYTKFDGDLFTVPESIDALYFDGLLYVENHSPFEKMFEIRDKYENKANTVISKFNESGIKFKDKKISDQWLVGDIRILRKMFEIRQNEIPTHATPSKIKSVIEKYGVDVEYTMENESIELDINRYHDIWELLRLLNADYAEAEIIPDGKLEINQKQFISEP